jgi:hypothetical protein
MSTHPFQVTVNNPRLMRVQIFETLRYVHRLVYLRMT